MTGVRFPPRLRPGDTVRVVAPSRSRALVMEHDHSAAIESRMATTVVRLTFGRHVDERYPFESSSGRAALPVRILGSMVLSRTPGWIKPKIHAAVVAGQLHSSGSKLRWVVTSRRTRAARPSRP